MAVIAPPIGAALLTRFRTCPKGDWRIGAPMYFCAGAPGRGAAPRRLALRSERRERLATAAAR